MADELIDELTTETILEAGSTRTPTKEPPTKETLTRDLLYLGPQGLTGPDQAFHIDAWAPTPLNLVTHAHADHARIGSEEYWCAEPCEPLLRSRLGEEIKIRSFPYGKKTKIGPAWVSFHPAGHILGSAQIRVEQGSEVWVFTGDYKRDPDPTCVPFEVVPCDTLITEATFGLPIYSWEPTSEVAHEIHRWWQWCKEEDTTALLFCYSLGKAQRILAELARFTDEDVFLHGAVIELTELYRAQGIRMLPTKAVSEHEGAWAGKLVIAPPSAHRSPWMKRFRSVSTAFASGWMAVRGIRRRRGYERGFVVSDHADWKGLIATVEETGASRVLVTHGSSETLAHYLSEIKKIKAEPLRTEFGGDSIEGEVG